MGIMSRTLQGAVTTGSYLEAKAYSNTGAFRGMYVLKVEKPSTARSSGLHMKGAVVVKGTVVGPQAGYYGWNSMTRGKWRAMVRDSVFHLCACNSRNCKETKIGASGVEHIDFWRIIKKSAAISKLSEGGFGNNEDEAGSGSNSTPRKKKSEGLSKKPGKRVEIDDIVPNDSEESLDASESDSERREEDPSADLVSMKTKPETLVAEKKTGRKRRWADKANLKAAPGAQGDALISSLSPIDRLAHSALQHSNVLLPKRS